MVRVKYGKRVDVQLTPADGCGCALSDETSNDVGSGSAHLQEAYEVMQTLNLTEALLRGANSL